MLSGEFSKIHSSGQFRGQGVDFGFGFFWCAFFGVGADHDVGATHFATGLTLACDFDDVVTVAGAHRTYNVAYVGIETCVFKGIQHHESAEPSEVSAVVFDAGVVTATTRPGDACEIFSAHDALLERLGFAMGDRGIGGCGVCAHFDEQMGGPHFFEGAVVGFGDEGIQEFVVHQIRARKLLAVTGKLIDKGGGGIHPKVLRGLDLQLEIDEQLHVVIEAFGRDEAVAVVLLENVRKVLCRDGFTGNGQDGLSVNGSRSSADKNRKGEDQFMDSGETAVAHRCELDAEFSVCRGAMK